jgi:hypothetical protein
MEHEGTRPEHRSIVQAAFRSTFVPEKNRTTRDTYGTVTLAFGPLREMRGNDVESAGWSARSGEGGTMEVLDVAVRTE